MTVSSWRECKLGELLEVKHGYAFKGQFFGSTGTHIVLTPGNFFDEGGFRSKGDEEKWYAGPIPSEYVLEKGDIVVAMTEQAEGLLGSSAIIPTTGLYLHNQRIGLVNLRADAADSRFISYLFNTRPVRQQIRASASGAKIRHTAPSRIGEVAVSIPPIAEQRRIAGILSAFDNLIESNLRRIRNLEDTAQAVYREWFIQFRFPGHQGVSFENSPLGPIPVGWKVNKMEMVAEVLDCLHSKKPKAQEDGTGTLIQLSNIGDSGKLDLRDRYLISAEDYQLWTSRIELRGGDCLVTNVGRVGAVAQIPVGVRAAAGRNMTAVRPREGHLTPTFLLEYLLSPQMMQETAKKKDLGTIMDSLNVKGIVKLCVPGPPIPLMKEFERLARPMRRLIEILVAQNQVLRTTRDLLLPRLMSGRLSLAQAEAAL